MNKGKYIVLEGPEGVGKTAQIQELAKRFQSSGLAHRVFREPDSQSDLTARAIRILTQDPHYPMNTKTETLLYNAARSQSLQVIKQCVEQGINCIVDRSYLTTLAVQYYGRGDITDYELINKIIDFAVDDMQPDLCIVLDAPVQTLAQRMKDRGGGERFDNLPIDFLERIRAGYLWEAKQRGFPVVYATESIDKIADQIWDIVAKELSVRNKTLDAKQSNPTSIAEIINHQKDKINHQDTAHDESSDYLEKGKDSIKITKSGEEYLNNILTDSKGDVYVFNENISPVTVAAAMARLSRRGDDMRITLLDEFIGNKGKDDELLKRVITAYGDDSVQQLTGLHIVVENASNLLTKKLEWGRLAAYLEQSTRYIYYDQKDNDGKYKYYVPSDLKPKVKKQYRQSMDKIFDLYSEMVRKLTDYVRAKDKTPENERDIAWKGATRAQACDAIRPVLPVATKSTVGIYASGQSLESLIYHLQSDELKEAKTTGDKILTEARKVLPMFLERADKPERGGAFVAYRANNNKNMSKTAQDVLKNTHPKGNDEEIVLTDYHPKNELDIAADMLYPYTNMSLKEIRNTVYELPYSKKQEIFNNYIGERLNRRHRPGRALEKITYSWDLICDYGIFRDLQRHRMVSDLEWQILSPRYGYEIPELVEESGLSDKFEECFDESLKLHSLLEENGYNLEAQYATLLGHKMRWKITYNAREAMHLHELRTAPQGHPAYRKLVKKMHDELANVHPLIAQSMKFVNKDEDPKLTRLAAERYTQFKLSQLDK